MTSKIENTLIRVFETKFGNKPVSIELLPQSGSYRKYFRLSAKTGETVIGVFNAEIQENRAFISFTKSFLRKDLPVPEIIMEDIDEQFYLLQDLGNTTLFNYLQTKPDENDVAELYRKIIDQLIRFQFDGHCEVDYSVCYPRNFFDAQSVMWDLNYFKYNFLKFLRISFHEQRLENDFKLLVQYTERIPVDSFLYRDFQSSNIMIHKNTPYFIDYQGGRKGAFYYDLASLLYDAKANLSNKLKEDLKEYYYLCIQKRCSIQKKEFDGNFTVFTLIRIMQAMGAYGFRGIFERKENFIKSIPYAVENLRSVIEKKEFSLNIPELLHVYNQLFKHPDCMHKKSTKGELMVRIYSFSFKKGMPGDDKGNGGGFVFDCRGLPNPGRFPEYRKFTGKDQKVIDFFQDKKVVHQFIDHVSDLVEITINDYRTSQKADLMISFGCTGGQHRSVYCAEQLVKFMKRRNIKYEIKHLEQENVF